MKKRMTLTQVAKELDVSVSTAWRWVTRGVKGRRLKSFLVGGRRFVTRRALNEFLRTSDESADVLSHDDAADALQNDGI